MDLTIKAVLLGSATAHESARRAAAWFNHPAAGQAGIAFLSAIERRGPGLPEPGRWRQQIQVLLPMDIKDLTEQQKLAFLDLAMLAMYADGHLTTAEDERIRRLLGTMGCTSDDDCNKQYDASVSRVSRHSQTTESARTHAATLAKSFTTREQRRRVLKIMDELVASDSHITLQESSLLSEVREALQL